MRSRLKLAVLPFALSVLTAALTTPVLAADPALKVIDSIKGADGPWDYATVDSAARRLYVARGDGVMVVNLDSKAVTETLLPGKRVHGVIMLKDGLAMDSNGDSGVATLFNAASGAVMAEFPAGQKPDALIRDPKTGLIAVMNHGDGSVTVIDSDKKQVVGSIAIGGTLEFAAADNDGHVYVNVEDKNELVGLDMAARTVIGRHPLPECDEPTGLALDAANHLLVAVCGNGKAVALSSRDGHVVASLPIGAGADAVLFDEKGKRFLVPCGGDGVLTVIGEAADGSLKVTGTIPTAKGARTGAIDETTGKIYLPTADFEPAKAGEHRKAVPGSFHILVVG